MSGATRRDLLKGGILTGLAGIAGCKGQEINSRTGTHQTRQEAEKRWDAPPKQKGNDLNVIVLVSDSFRADNLAAYGSEWIETPNLNKFASEAIIFDSFYPEGMPTVPIRRQLYTGRRIVPTHSYFQQGGVQYCGWHPLYMEDVTLAETLSAANYKTALIADLYHIMKPGLNFHRGFTCFEWIRGQEVDYYALAPRQMPDTSALYPAEYLQAVEGVTKPSNQGPILRRFLNQYLANRKRWLQHGDSIAEQTAKASIDWLKQNHAEGPFYLHVEIFDPHEPWDPPAQFLEKYLKKPTKHSWPEPPNSYVNAKVTIPPEGVERLRANYAGEASNVDYWYGQVLDTIQSLGLYDNSIVVFLSDHGALLNEQKQWTKGPEKIRTQVTHVPLLMHLPKGQYAGTRVAGFAQTPDVVPTILGRLDLKPSARVTGEDLWRFVTGEKRNQRDYIVSAYGTIAAVRTPEWNYSAVWDKKNDHSGYAPQLYDVRNDPHELANVAAAHPSVLKALQTKMDEYIASGRDITDGTFSREIF